MNPTRLRKFSVGFDQLCIHKTCKNNQLNVCFFFQSNMILPFLVNSKAFQTNKFKNCSHLFFKFFYIYDGSHWVDSSLFESLLYCYLLKRLFTMVTMRLELENVYCQKKADRNFGLTGDERLRISGRKNENKLCMEIFGFVHWTILYKRKTKKKVT